MDDSDHHGLEPEKAAASEDVRAFLAAVGGKFACPSCGQTTMWDMERPHRSSVLVFAGGGGFAVPARVHTYAIACANCGLIRQYVRDVVDRKISAPEATGNE